MQKKSINFLFELNQTFSESSKAMNSGVNGEIGREAIAYNIGKLPALSTEAMPLIDHPSLIGMSVSTADEDCLTAITISRPFVKHQHARKVGDIVNQRQLCTGQEVVRGL